MTCAGSFDAALAAAVLAWAVLAAEMDRSRNVPYDSNEAGAPAGGH